MLKILNSLSLLGYTGKQRTKFITHILGSLVKNMRNTIHMTIFSEVQKQYCLIKYCHGRQHNIILQSMGIGYNGIFDNLLIIIVIRRL